MLTKSSCQRDWVGTVTPMGLCYELKLNDVEAYRKGDKTLANGVLGDFWISFSCDHFRSYNCCEFVRLDLWLAWIPLRTVALLLSYITAADRNSRRVSYVWRDFQIVSIVYLNFRVEFDVWDDTSCGSHALKDDPFGWVTTNITLLFSRQTLYTLYKRERGCSLLPPAERDSHLRKFSAKILKRAYFCWPTFHKRSGRPVKVLLWY